MIWCNNYKIRNNDIFSTGYTGPGIEVYRSLGGSHEIFRNTFSKLNVGINCMDINNSNNNDGLLMNCNINNLDANNYDIVMSHTSGLANPTVKKVQGEVNGSPASEKLVRNIYGATCANSQNMWQIYSAATQTVDHGANTTTSTAVTQPTGSCKSPLLNVVDMGIPLIYSTHCSLYPPTSGGSSTVQSQRLSVLNDHIGTLQSTNSGGENDFEIQSSVGSKLNLFIGDSVLYNLDSVVEVLNTNPGSIDDADIQLVFAYMAKADYVAANNIIDNWNGGGFRQDWSAVLSALITIEQNAVDGVFELDLYPTEKNLFISYCENENDARRLACAILSVGSDFEITEPHALPETGGSSRPGINNIQNFVNNPDFRIYPNPASSGFHLLKNDKNEGVVELRDLLGRQVLSQKINNGQTKTFVNLNNLPSGMYMVTFRQGQNVTFTSKIVKEN